MHPRCRCTIIASIDDGKQGRKTTDQRAAEGRSRVPADMSYRDWLKSLTPNSKIRAGLSAGSNELTTAEGSPPKLIGKLDTVTAAAIQKTLERYERQIAAAPIEHALIITVLGEVYHCTGDVNSLNSIVELGDKLEGAHVTHNHPAGSDNEYSFSDDDLNLFRAFKLARLRGVDKRFVYEFNRNAADIDRKNISAGMDNYKHWDNTRKAELLGIGYRRWAR